MFIQILSNILNPLSTHKHILRESMNMETITLGVILDRKRPLRPGGDFDN